MSAVMPVREEARDDKEAKILAAAKELFLEQGFAATSMDLVAQRARASKTTLYTRFPSKEALFSAVIVAECDAYGLRFSPQVFADVSLDEALRRIASRFLELICSPQSLRVEQVIMAETTRFPELARSFGESGPEQLFRAVSGYFEDAARRGLIETTDPRFLAEQFLAVLKGPHQFCLMRGADPPKAGPERDRFIARAVDLFLNGALRHG
jgi:TetR/AcrR family transcriptional repressor of mexJK operon